MDKFLRISLILFLVIFNSCQPGTSEQKKTALAKEISVNAEDVLFGNPTAPATVFMFASYNCNYCRYFFSRTFPELKKNYLDKGKVKLVVKWVDFQDNPQILRSLQVASCISRFGVYEKYHELLLVNPEVVFTNEFVELVDDIMEKNEEIAECVLNDPEYTYLRQNVKEFRENNLNGTPTFILNNHVYSGFISYDNFVTLLNKELNL